MSECSLLVEHSLKYTNKQPLAVKDVIESLRGLEKISVYFLPAALSTLTGTEVVTAELLVEGFEQGSFIEKVLLRLTFRDETGMNTFLDRVREGAVNVYRKLPGEGRPVLKAIAVSSVIGSLVVAGTVYAISTKEAVPAGVTINIADSNFIAIGAEAYQVSPEQFVAVIEAVGSIDKKKLAQSAAKVVAPAKREEGAEIVMNDNAQMLIPSATVSQVPDTVEFDAFEIDQPHRDVDLEIRATDLDYSRGWAGVINGIADRRVKLLFADGVDSDALAGKLKVRADVVVKSRMSAKSKKMEPVSITITELIDD